MPVKVDILDSATPWLEWAAKEYPKYVSRGLKSLGWWTQKQIKAGIKSKSPGGQPYKTNAPAKVRRKIEEAFGKTPKNAYPIMGRLRAAIGYQFNRSDQSVTVGWLSLSAVQLGKKLEEGFDTRVTTAMKLALHGGGLHGLAEKNVIRTPARPTIGPMFDALQNKFHPYLEEKIWGYIQGNENRGVVKTNKKYIVKGEFW